MIQTLKKIDNTLAPIWEKVGYGGSVVNLIARLYMANIFFKSGMLKWADISYGRFDDVVTAFTEFYPIPGVPPEIAAVAGTAGELILPVLLAFGFMGRIGAAGLLMMTLVIQFAVPADYGISNPEHYIWMLLLAVPLFHGMGHISIDYWLAKWIRSK